MTGIRKSFLATAETSGFIFMIFLGADMLNSTLALSQMPAQLAETVASLGVPLARGRCSAFWCSTSFSARVMDELSMILLTIPVLFPAIMGLDFYGLPLTEKAIWFGILVLMVVEVGLIAPPVGTQRLRDPQSRQGRSDGGDLPRRRAVSDHRRGPHHAARLLPALSLWLVRLIT